MEHKTQQFYTCPMHPEIKRDTAGICPECGMNLIQARTHADSTPVPEQATPSGSDALGSSVRGTARTHTEHDKHGGHSTEMPARRSLGAGGFLRKFWVSLILSVFVVLYSDIVEKLFGFRAPEFLGSEYVPFALGSVVFFYGGWIFIASAWRELQAKLPGMMTLIALAITTAYLYSISVIVIGEGNTLFWELTTLITVMLLGHFVEMKAVSGAQGALKELSKLLPDTAEVIKEGGAEIIPVTELREGDAVFVRPGGRIPADGVVIEGKSEVNEAMVTGESAPVSKSAGSEVIAGTVSSDGALKIQVTKIGERTFLAGIMRLVEEAQASKSRLQILSDRAAYYLTLIAIATGGLTFTVWLLPQTGGGDFGFALERLVAVLVIACPHALGLAVPLVASISTTMAARNGFLVRERLSLELARKIDIVLFDKTGTLTKGEYGVTNIWNVSARDEKEALSLAASVDAHSEHFISQAMVRRARDDDVPLLEVKEFERIPGRGVKGIVNPVRSSRGALNSVFTETDRHISLGLATGHSASNEVNGDEIFVGGLAMLEYTKASLPEGVKDEIERENKTGKTIIFAIRGQEVLGVFALADLIREESREAIRDLKEMGVKVAMVTGDSENVAAWVAGELQIDEYFAKVLPREKSEKVKLLQSKGYKAAMVGDGINDAPALTQSDLGIAIGAGTNVAIESAGIILVRNDPRDIVRIIKLSRLTYAKMIQNLFWATGYNVVAIPLAAGVLAFKGIYLQPALAALFMSLSTVIVAVNAVLLRKKVL